jgi:asparagine synthase (glutamine-hydrolysing)
MSGMVGLINTDGQPVDRRLLQHLTEFMEFRGPDARNIWISGQVGFGHTLLRTTFESEREEQPCSLEGQVWITADARIDGRADLIRRLEGQGCLNLKATSDPELILHAYHVWGEDCLQYLLGDFAFAIWDGPKRQLFCARDHFGVKPFYYARVGNCLVFSNTLNCLRRHPEVSDELNDLAIADFLLFDFNQDPATTSFADIHRVPPAHCLTLHGGALQVRRYWTLPQEGLLRYARQQDYVDHFKELLKQAVADRLRTRAVGVFMSGGLDSPMVAALAKDLLAAQPTPYDLQAYTVVYDRLVPDKERHFAGLVAAYVNIPINFLAADAYRLYGRGEQGKAWQSEPSHNQLLEIWLDLIRRASAKSRVFLTGEGGDEILYPSKAYIYRLVKGGHFGRLALETARSVFLYGMFPQIGFRSSLRRWLIKADNSLPLPVWLNPALAARLDLKARVEELRKPVACDYALRPEAYRFLLTPMWQFVLEKKYDPGELGYPVEIRHPLIDLRLVNYALALPPLPWCVNKLMLREAGYGILPTAITRRAKSPMAVSPILALLRERPDDRIDCPTPVAQLNRYVDNAAIPPVTGVNATDDAWVHLRALSLNNWLQNLQPVYLDRVANSEHK